MSTPPAPPTLPLEIQVNPRVRMVDTGIEVFKGQTFTFEASGEWTDFWIRTDANGFPDNPADFLGERRFPQFHWLALLGCVGRDDGEVFLIGGGGETSRTFETTGRLFVFANDNRSWAAYVNNWGRLTLRISAPGQ